MAVGIPGGLGLPPVIGHRGAAGLAPENTLASFALAADLGCRMVEFDVRLSADGQPVIFHDDTLERCTPARGPVRARSAHELAALGIPTLSQVLSLCLDRGMDVNMEIKPDAGTGSETAYAALTCALAQWPADRPAPLVSSFDEDSMREAALAAPHWPRGLLVGRIPADWRQRARRLDVVSIHAAARGLKSELVAEIVGAGLNVLAYTVNGRKQAHTLWAMGVISVYTDRPDILLPK